MSRDFYSEGAKQGTQTPSPAPRLIPAKRQPRTYIAIGTTNGGTSAVAIEEGSAFGIVTMCGANTKSPEVMLLSFVSASSSR